MPPNGIFQGLTLPGVTLGSQARRKERVQMGSNGKSKNKEQKPKRPVFGFAATILLPGTVIFLCQGTVVF